MLQKAPAHLRIGQAASYETMPLTTALQLATTAGECVATKRQTPHLTHWKWKSTTEAQGTRQVVIPWWHGILVALQAQTCALAALWGGQAHLCCQYCLGTFSIPEKLGHAAARQTITPQQG